MSLPSIDKSSRSSRTGAFDFEAAPAFLIYLGRAITLVAITLAPWFFGCVRFQEQVWLYSAMTIAAVIATIVVTIRAIKTPEAGSLRFPLLAIPMIAGIGLGAVQLLPAEQELTTSRVTQSAELAQWDLGEPIKSTRYSFYPHLTVLEIARYTFATVAFFIGYTLFRTPSSQRLLWAWLLGNGLVLAAFGIIQKFSWNGKLFWNVVLSNGGDPFASFVNRNNAMAFLYITIAAGLGLLAWSIERRPVRATTGLLSALLARVAALEALQVCLLCGLVLLGAGIIASTSRSGALCACIAGLVVVVFTSVRRRSAWPLVVAGLGLGIGTAAVLTLEVNDQLAERIARVDTERLEERTRVRHAKDALGVTKALPVLGSGLGTHRYAYLPFVSEFGRLWAFNADNQYVEIAVETGLSGLAIVTLLVLLTCWLIASGRKTTIESAGTGVAAIFLLCSQLFHGLFDFGIILPATLLATSVMIGTAVASVSSRTGGRGASAWSGRWALPSTMLAILT
ncbi:MAG: O-antigen ligase family protein, partial [Planctomycetaceae bacterium]